jgi:D-beta-D-heptose 7-phosphate kinase / D-beta-D-heptose 1-phosphate adenosyltransferase
MSNNLFSLMAGFSKLKILVIGEAMLDRYLKGTTTRLSQEAPVQVVSLDEKENIPGGAANTAANIRSLGAEPIFLSVIGDDEEGEILRQALRNYGISDENIITSPARQTLAKQRVLANGQMMIRFDQGSTCPLDEKSEAALSKRIRKLAPQVDGIIVSDYDYGIITPKVLNALRKAQAREPRILVVDAKSYLPYQPLRVTAVKPNYAETVQILGLEAKADSEERLKQIEEHGPKILAMANAQIAAITLDQDGAHIFERGQPAYRVYARPAGHNRVAGAGDTFMSALALALAAGGQAATAAELASAAAAIVVEKPGTSTCYIEELESYFSGEEKYITDNFHMAARVAAYRRQGKRIVFTNGCFDILHSGHIQHLNMAKALGDVLIVGINSDPGVARLKGPNRPINALEDRAQVLSALSCVDHIIPFDEDIPYSLIAMIRPEVFVKGGDYSLDLLPEAALVREQGGEVQILPYVEDHSTTGIIERIRQIYALESSNKEPPVKLPAQKDFPTRPAVVKARALKETSVRNKPKKQMDKKATMHLK